MELGRLNRESTAFHWLIGDFLLPVGSAIAAGCESSPLWSPESILIEVSVY